MSVESAPHDEPGDSTPRYHSQMAATTGSIFFLNPKLKIAEFNALIMS